VRTEDQIRTADWNREARGEREVSGRQRDSPLYLRYADFTFFDIENQDMTGSFVVALF